MDFAAPLAIGLLGSLHCVGMCGPINLALPLGYKLNFKFFFRSLQFHTGRILMYGALGALFGGLGFGLKLAGLQQWLSIGLGSLMIVSVLIPQFLAKTRKTQFFYESLTHRVKLNLGKMLGSKNASILFIAGFLNGLLPCGLVYLAIAGAISSGNFQDGAMFMVFFGLGTLPALLGVILFKGFISSETLSKSKKIIPLFIVFMGVIFVLRGMNLGIPYISPKINAPATSIEECN